MEGGAEVATVAAGPLLSEGLLLLVLLAPGPPAAAAIVVVLRRVLPLALISRRGVVAVDVVVLCADREERRGSAAAATLLGLRWRSAAARAEGARPAGGSRSVRDAPGQVDSIVLMSTMQLRPQFGRRGLAFGPADDQIVLSDSMVRPVDNGLSHAGVSVKNASELLGKD
jgi:hypothetical protein